MKKAITIIAMIVALVSWSDALAANPVPRTAVQSCHWNKADLVYFRAHPRSPITRKACESGMDRAAVRRFLLKGCFVKPGRPINGNPKNWVCPESAPSH